MGEGALLRFREQSALADENNKGGVIMSASFVLMEAVHVYQTVTA
jgi:hypothetical protein